MKAFTHLSHFATAHRNGKESICDWLQRLTLLMVDAMKQYAHASTGDQQELISKVLKENPLAAYYVFEAFMHGLGKNERTIPLVSEISDKFYASLQAIKNWDELIEFKNKLELSSKLYESSQWMPTKEEIESIASTACRSPEFAKRKEAKGTSTASKIPFFPPGDSKILGKPKPAPAPKAALSESDPHPVHTKYTVKQGEGS